MKTTAIGVVKAKTLIKALANGVSISVHYDTPPSSLTPIVDIDAKYQATFDKKSKSWTVSFYGKSGGFSSTETFVEDASGQTI